MPGRAYSICTVCMDYDALGHHSTHPDVKNIYFCSKIDLFCVFLQNTENTTRVFIIIKDLKTQI